MYRYATYSVLLLLLVSAPLRADQSQAKDYQAAYDACLKQAGAINNGVVTGCAEGISSDAKAEINLLYKKLHDQFEAKAADDAVNFDKAQKAWLTYRNAHCELAGKYVGDPEFYVCPMDLNIERVHQLRQLDGSE